MNAVFLQYASLSLFRFLSFLSFSANLYGLYPSVSACMSLQCLRCCFLSACLRLPSCLSVFVFLCLFSCLYMYTNARPAYTCILKLVGGQSAVCTVGRRTASCTDYTCRPTEQVWRHLQAEENFEQTCANCSSPIGAWFLFLNSKSFWCLMTLFNRFINVHRDFVTCVPPLLLYNFFLQVAGEN